MHEEKWLQVTSQWKPDILEFARKQNVSDASIHKT